MLLSSGDSESTFQVERRDSLPACLSLRSFPTFLFSFLRKEKEKRAWAQKQKGKGDLSEQPSKSIRKETLLQNRKEKKKLLWRSWNGFFLVHLTCFVVVIVLVLVVVGGGTVVVAAATGASGGAAVVIIVVFFCCDCF